MQIPEHVLEIVEAAVKEHPNDIPTACATAHEAIRSLEDYDEFVETLVADEVQKLVYSRRGMINNRIRRENGSYHTGTKVNGVSKRIEDAMSCYLYCIGSRTLGDIRFCELDDIEKKERSQANGHIFNAELVAWLRTKGAGEAKIKDIVPHRELKKNFQRIEKMVVQHLEPAMAGD